MKRSLCSYIPIATLIAFLLATYVVPQVFAQAASELHLSKNADYSTEDRIFSQNDILYIKVVAPRIDPDNLDKNEFKLSSSSSENDIEGTLDYTRNNAFTAQIILNTLEPRFTSWRVEVRLEDKNEHEFRQSLNITIQADTGDSAGSGDDAGNGNTGGSDSGDENNGANDTNDENAGGDNAATGQAVTIIGEVEAIDSQFITVSGTTFVVDAQTAIVNESESSIPYAWLGIGAQVTIRGMQKDSTTLFAGQIQLHLQSPAYFQLHQNYPNPFRARTTIEFELFDTITSPVHITVFDALGREIALLADESLPAGRHEVSWSPAFSSSKPTSGLYFYRIEIEGFAQTRSMVWISE